MRPSRVLCGLATCVVLGGCAQESRGEAAPESSAHEWRDATYTITCDGVVPRGFSTTLRNGAAVVPAEPPQPFDSFVVHLETTATGDLDGDGRPDTVVLLECHPEPSN